MKMTLKQINIIITALIITSLLVIQINVYSYTLNQALLIVNIDGTVSIIYTVKNVNPEENITIPLLGKPIYIEAYSDGVPQPLQIQDNTVKIIMPASSELSIKYVTSDLTNKTGEEWTLNYDSQWNSGVILPSDAIILEVNPQNFDVDIVNNSVILLFPPGKVSIKYIFIPSAPTQPPSNNLPTISQNWLILLLLIILGIGFVLAIRHLHLRRKKPIIDKEALDERDSQIIKALETSGKLTAKEIMEKTGIPKTPLYRRLNRLVKQGYIEKKTISGVTYFKLKEND